MEGASRRHGYATGPRLCVTFGSHTLNSIQETRAPRIIPEAAGSLAGNFKKALARIGQLLLWKAMERRVFEKQYIRR